MRNDEHDEIEHDMLIGSIGDETDVQINKTRNTVTLVQLYWGSNPESVTLDEEQQLDLLFKLADKFGLTVS